MLDRISWRVDSPNSQILSTPAQFPRAYSQSQKRKYWSREWAGRWSGLPTSSQVVSAFLDYGCFEFVKVCWIIFSSWESFIGFYILWYPISTLLACLFPVEVRISGPVLERVEQSGWDAISCLLTCVLFCMEGEFQQINTKIRLSFKDNNNLLQSKLYRPFSISYKF